MRQTIWLLTLALAAGLAGAEGEREVGGVTLHPGPQDIVQVRQNGWLWGSGPQKYPAVNLTFQSGRFKYVLRHDKLYEHGQLGLTGPTPCNWYQAGMIQLYLNGERVNLTPAEGELLQTHNGPTGRAAFTWSDSVATTTWQFFLKAGEDRLYLVLDLVPAADLKSLELRLMNYPSGFNRAPQHHLSTPLRELTEPGLQTLDPATEPALFLADDTLDPATSRDAAGPSAVAVDPTGLTGLTARTGGYGVPLSLTYDPGTRRLALCFWEYPARGNDDARQRFKSAWQDALKTLGTLGGEQ